MLYEKSLHKRNELSIKIIFVCILYYTAISPMIRILGQIFPIDNLPLLPVTILTIIIYFISNIKYLVKYIPTKKIYVFGLFILSWIVIIQIINLFEFNKIEDGINLYILRISTTLFASILMWIAGSNLDKIYYIFVNNKTFRILSYIIYLSYLLIIVYSISFQVGQNGYSISDFKIYRDGWTLDYLYIGDTFTFISLLIIPWIPNRYIKIGLYILNIILVYSLISRTSWYLYMGSLIILLVTSKNWTKKIYFISIFIILISFNIDTEQMSNNRMLSVLTDIKNDRSYYERQELKENAIKELEDIWLLGNFASEIKEDNNIGGYAHNIISYWTSYGIIPFLLMIILLILTLIKILQYRIKFKDNILIMSILGVGVYWIVASIFSRSYIYPYIWFVIGAVTLLDKSTCLNHTKSIKNN